MEHVDNARQEKSCLISLESHNSQCGSVVKNESNIYG